MPTNPFEPPKEWSLIKRELWSAGIVSLVGLFVLGSTCITGRIAVWIIHTLDP